MLTCDVAIIGAGPVGLSFAATLADRGLTSILLERAPEAAIADPAQDGREIALTHRAIAIMQRLGAWDLLPEEGISPLRAARVLDGTSPYALRFDPDGQGESPLGKLVGNHLIRRTIYAAAMRRDGLRLLTGRTATCVLREPGGVVVHASGGEPVRARLAVAADTRFSPMREAEGIPILRDDFGTSMVVCRMRHERPHDHIATERFAYGQIIATLPMNGLACSVVITRRRDRIASLAALPVPEFVAEVTRGVRGSLGAMNLEGERYVYPLIGTFARRFVGPRFALLGDAAVGMHPVTALGFNIGLRGQDTLAEAIAEAQARGADIASPDVLRRYEIAHRRLAWPLWVGTNVVARLYGAQGPVARVARRAALRLAEHLPPFKHAVTALLMDRARA
jgi:ubiquinone biosynthesis UbiH/UbiF/VisC/COQ6 family hydroxylase